MELDKLAANVLSKVSMLAENKAARELTIDSNTGQALLAVMKIASEATSTEYVKVAQELGTNKHKSRLN